MKRKSAYLIMTMQQKYNNDVNVVNFIIKMTIKCTPYAEFTVIETRSNFV